MEQCFLEIGKIVNTHGLKGDIKVVPWSDYPEIFEELDNIYLDENTKINIKSVKYQKNNVILKLDKINTIDDALKIKDKIIYVLKDELGELMPDTFFIADLIGLDVICDDDKIGCITDVIPNCGADIYVISPIDGKKDILLPAIKENILEINLEKSFIKISIPNGLLD